MASLDDLKDLGLDPEAYQKADPIASGVESKNTKKVFDVQSFLQDPPDDLPELKGAKLVGMRDDGIPEFKLKDNSVIAFDLKNYVKDDGANLNHLDFQFNSIKNPLPDSPVSILDRFRQGFGNKEGVEKDLKKSFQDVVWDDDSGDFLVRNNGAWSRVDGQILADRGEKGRKPFDLHGKLFKELAGEVAENVATGIEVAGGALGTGLGTITGVGPAGGAFIGGTAASKLNTSLGRAFNTYENSVAGEVLDNTVDGVLNLLGERAITLGGKYAMPHFTKMMTKLRDLKSGSKEVITDMFSNVLGVSKKWVGKARDNLVDVMPHIQLISKEGEEGFTKVVQGQIDLVDDLVKEIDGAKSNVYKERLAKALNFAKEDGVTIDPIRELDGLAKEVENIGLGSIQTGKGGRFKIGQLTDDGLKAFKEKNPEDIPIQLDGKELAKFESELNSLYNGLLRDASFQKGGPDALVVLDKALTRFPSAFDKGSRSFKIASELARNSKVKLSNSLTKSPRAAEEYLAAKKEYGDFIREFEDLLNLGEKSPAQKDAFIKRVFSETGNDSLKSQFSNVRGQLSPKGKYLVNQLENAETAKKILPMIPDSGSSNPVDATWKWAKQQGKNMAIANLSRGYAKHPLVQNVRETSKTLKSLSPVAKRELLNNSQLLGQMFVAPVNSLMEEQGMNDAMMKHIEESIK